MILGTFPSPASRADGFYYGHPQNRFWKILAAVYEESAPYNLEQKKELLIRHKIALWDVLYACTITKAADASIRNEKANDITALCRKYNIGKVLLNGKTAGRLYEKYNVRTAKRTVVDGMRVDSKSAHGVAPEDLRLSEDLGLSEGSPKNGSCGYTIPQYAILPSTSPANAAIRLPELVKIWKEQLILFSF